MKILVTGAAGFIGFHLCKLLSKKNTVVGVDIINNYYSTKLKRDRLKELKSKNLFFLKLIYQIKKLEKVFKK